MKINRVTITGVDDFSDLDKIQELDLRFKFVEWGFLFSKTKCGTNRYPSFNNLKALCHAVRYPSAHFCGAYAYDVLAKGETYLLDEYSPYYFRIQLNFNFSVNNKYHLEPVVNWASDNPSTSLIFQANKSNKKVIDELESCNLPNIHFLYDSSGGRGTEIKTVYDPFKNHYTGYAGGITPINISDISWNIINGTTNDLVWIDMESGVRTNDALDMGKVQSVLETCSNFV